MNSDEPIDNTGSAFDKSDELRSRSDLTSSKSHPAKNAAQKLTSTDNHVDNANDQTVQKVSLSDEDIKNIDKYHLIEACLEQRLPASDTRDGDLISRLESDDKLTQQLLESTRRENILLMRLFIVIIRLSSQHTQSSKH